MTLHSSRLTSTAIFVLLFGTVSVFALLWTVASPGLKPVIALGLVYLTATVAFYMFVGNSGVFSFGHVAFMMIGAYAGGLLAIEPADKLLNQPGMPAVLMSAHLPPYLAAVTGGLVAAVVAAALSIPLIRLSGLTASLVSFAILQIVYVIAANWKNVTGASSGLVDIPILGSATTLWVTASVAILAALVFQQSRWGRRLRASREDEIAAQAVGLAVHTDRRVAFILSAFFIGVAGALYGQLLGAIVPQSLYLTATTLILIMLVVGGMGSLSGAVFGSIFIATVTQLLVRVQNGFDVGDVSVKGPIGTLPVGLSLIMLLTLILLPKGITGSQEITILAKPLAAVARVTRLPSRLRAS